MRMRTKLLLAAFAGMGLTTGVAQAQVGYTLDVTTHYQNGAPAAGTLNGVTGGPDTGFFEITNNGSSTFTGTISDIAKAANGSDDSFISAALTLAPGASDWVGIGHAGSGESSNQGGYNGPTGTVQPGVIIDLIGTISQGIKTEPISLSVDDKDIHSGIVRSANGHLSDSYVLQGGDPTGGDTGDAFELTQADGHFRFFEAPAGGTATPLPASAWGGMALLGGLAASRLIHRRTSVA